MTNQQIEDDNEPPSIAFQIEPSPTGLLWVRTARGDSDFSVPEEMTPGQLSYELFKWTAQSRRAGHG